MGLSGNVIHRQSITMHIHFCGKDFLSLEVPFYPEKFKPLLNDL